MKAALRVTAALLMTAATASAQVSLDSTPPAIKSTVVTTQAGELVLLQEVLVEAPISKVWAAYTTEAGWTAWASPLAKIDLRAGGTIRTHYDSTAMVGDPGTNTLHVINYVPERLLTLQAELGERWPEAMKLDAEYLMNVIVFDSTGANQTKIFSYGVGYRDAEAHSELMDFFIPANEALFGKLKAALEP